MRTSAKPPVDHRHLTTCPQLQQKGAKAVARHLRANLPGDGSVDNVEVAFSVAVTRTAEPVMPIISPILLTCPLHANSGCGKEGRILIGSWGSAKPALFRNYLEVYWPCPGGLSAVNDIGAQLRDPINSGLTRWHMAVLNK